jgi:hypothetical protein
MLKQISTIQLGVPAVFSYGYKYTLTTLRRQQQQDNNQSVTPHH